MAIDLLNLEPTTISRDLRDKYLCIYGKPKVGKTSFAAQLPNNLIAAFEVGTNALSNIYAQKIQSWKEWKQFVKQLEDPKVQARFHTITIDTIGIMWEKCEEFICQQEAVNSLADIAWGKGYALCKKEFERSLRKITMLGYGLIIIAHVDIKTEKGADGTTEVEIIGPAIPKRAYEIVNQLVDVIGYISMDFRDDGTAERLLYLRATPTVTAGSRFAHMPAKIPFGYQELVDTLGDAIAMSERVDGAIIVDQKEHEIITRSFEEVMNEAGQLWTSLAEKSEENVPKMMAIVEDYFGQPIRLSTAVAKQQTLVEGVIDELKKML